MQSIHRGRAFLRALAMALFTVSLTGCVSMYVDNTVKEVAVADYQKPAQAKPVQLFFEFRTKGVLNQQATGYLKARVTDQIRGSGLFSEVSEGPVADGASLSVVLDNVPMSDDAFSKGFATGLTFGLAGSQVGDGYLCTATYRGPDTPTPIVKKARTAIYTTMGNAGTPTNADKAANGEEAITRVVRIAVSQVLNETTRDPSFK